MRIAFTVPWTLVFTIRYQNRLSHGLEFRLRKVYTAVGQSQLTALTWLGVTCLIIKAVTISSIVIGLN